MASIRSEAAKRTSSLRTDMRRPLSLPEWWPLAQVVLGVVVAVGVLFTATRGDDVAAPPSGDNGGAIIIPTVPTSLPSADPDGSPPPTGPAVSAGTVTLPSSGGVATEVPEAAVERARAVLRSSGTPAATFESVVVATQTPSLITLLVTWDPDGDAGGLASRVTSVSLRPAAGGGWEVL
jgi:hypothetical protein